MLKELARPAPTAPAVITGLVRYAATNGHAPVSRAEASHLGRIIKELIREGYDEATIKWALIAWLKVRDHTPHTSPLRVKDLAPAIADGDGESFRYLTAAPRRRRSREEWQQENLARIADWAAQP